MQRRWFASVAERKATPQVRHYMGLPPELTQGRDDRVRLPWPRILIMEEGAEGGVILYRYARDGAPAGDTWHANAEDAHHQAEVEYSEALGEWKDVPSEVDDAVAFALTQVP